MVSPSLIASVKLNLRRRRQSGTYGWLVDLINYFGYQGGFAQIEQCFQREELTPAEMAALLAPVGRLWVSHPQTALRKGPIGSTGSAYV